MRVASSVQYIDVAEQCIYYVSTVLRYFVCSSRLMTASCSHSHPDECRHMPTCYSTDGPAIMSTPILEAKRAHNAHSLLLRLPPELLCYVFALVKAECDVDRFLKCREDRLGWLVLTHVCHYARTVRYTTTASFWNTLFSDNPKIFRPH